jgi:o-succinylbenzoate synthase
MKQSVFDLRIPLRGNFSTANATLTERELLLVRLQDRMGHTGFGEAAPLESYDGIALWQVAHSLLGRSTQSPEPATAALEMALLDLYGKRTGCGLVEARSDKVAVNCTLANTSPSECAASARRGLKQGYFCFKVKVGTRDDHARIAAVRAAIGPQPRLRVDANGCWSVREATAAIEALSAYDLELVEQPCQTLDQLACVRSKTGVSIAADESIRTADDVRGAARIGACDIVNIKLATSGGFKAARATVRAARQEGLSVFLSSTLDGPLTIAAALRLAASEEINLACGLATLDLFDSPLKDVLAPPAQGYMAVPTGPGLGVSISHAQLASANIKRLS